MTLNLAHTLARSRVNGPGERYVLWVQGCRFACPGCWNPDTWSFNHNRLREVDEIAEEILATPGIEGVTFSGGEPFTQATALAGLASLLRRHELSVMVYTGYEREALVSAAHRALLMHTDILVSGRYRQELRTLDSPWRGSSNQEVHFLTPRYTLQSLENQPVAEIHLEADGGALVTGFPPDFLRG